jgi:hypothetical protein
VELKWQTASEQENAGFIIMRSDEENGEFRELDSYKNNSQLQGAGSSSEEHAYQYLDTDVRNDNTYWYKLVDVSFAGWYSVHGPVSAMPAAYKGGPERLHLAQNFPNPFNTSTIIELTLWKAGYIELKVFNVLGEEVHTLVAAKLEAGKYQICFQCGDLPSGLYYCRLTSGSSIQVRKMMVLR